MEFQPSFKRSNAITVTNKQVTSFFFSPTLIACYGTEVSSQSNSCQATDETATCTLTNTSVTTGKIKDCMLYSSVPSKL